MEQWLTAIPLSLCPSTPVVVQRGCFFALSRDRSQLPPASALGTAIASRQSLRWSLTLLPCLLLLLLSFSFSGLLLIMTILSLSLAACKLFTNGTIGDSLLDNLSDDLFPANDTWNQYPYLSADMAMSLCENCSPTRILPPDEQTFVEMSTGAVRASPAHRLWTSEDHFAANQRSHFSFSIMVLRFCKVEGDFADPLLW
jgi:hypothetical protein